jgi:hypothetical protein
MNREAKPTAATMMPKAPANPLNPVSGGTVPSNCSFAKETDRHRTIRPMTSYEIILAGFIIRLRSSNQKSTQDNVYGGVHLKEERVDSEIICKVAEISGQLPVSRMRYSYRRYMDVRVGS